MTLSYSTKIKFSAGKATKAIFDSVSTDNKFYPENPTKTKISYDKKILVEIKSEQDGIRAANQSLAGPCSAGRGDNTRHASR